MTSLRLRLFAVLSWLCLVLADATNDTGDPKTTDPYLPYKPEFARSLPVQTLVTGVVFTLVAVLFVHIVFTGQYHWPLAPVNYALQLSGVITLLVSLIATIRVIFASAMTESAHWPYMLSYIAVNVPPLDSLNVSSTGGGPAESTWSTASRGTWLLMNATVSTLVQITHIQFLTLLYPSRLEGRLIYSLLGPLSITAAIMQLMPIQPNNGELILVANYIRNVCNATLSLLFTAALFIWGLLVNRSQAWRTDGGTAVFGACALSLALVSTALNFLYVPKNQEYVWLPGLIWAVILWQSFFGWWWWVGAGSGQTIDVKRGEKLEAKKKRQTRGRKEKPRKIRRRADDDSSAHEQEIQDGASVRSSLSDESSTTRVGRSASTLSRPHRGASSTSLSSADTITSFPRFLPKTVQAWYTHLRHAHVAAARQQTLEQAERIRELGRGRTPNPEPERRLRGWGLGSFGWRVDRDVYEFEMQNNPRRRRRSDEGHDSGSEEDRGPRLPRQGSPISAKKAEREREYTQPNTRHRVASNGGERQSIWWWGPLNRWRLQDSTVYH